MVGKKIESINLPSKSNQLFFLIHGYSGSTSDFGDLPQILHKTFNANVICKLLPGHGTNIEDLEKYELEDFISNIERELQNEIKKGREIILIGISFGAQMALHLASKHSIKGIILLSNSHSLKFPFYIPKFEIIRHLKKTWNKNYSRNELELRKNAFYYNEMPSKALLISKNLKKLYNSSLEKIDAPIMIIHSKGDKLGSHTSIKVLFNRVNSRIKEKYIIDVPNHNIFYSTKRKVAIKKIIIFLQTLYRHYSQNTKEKVSAIIPAYNEGKNISNILKTLSKVKPINEIIVIDDGSTDNTEEQVRKFPHVKYLKNNPNKGKGFSMDRGVKNAKNDTIFFCDADLINFKPEHAEQIITPVLLNEVDMFIGMRGNFMQRKVKAWGLNSGERTLRKKTWFSLPSYYKHRYRIELGLNQYVQKHSKRGLGWKMFDYSQPLKEKKYGFLSGTLLRWWMNYDVMVSYFLTKFKI